jgi:hypothetical protein
MPFTGEGANHQLLTSGQGRIGRFAILPEQVLTALKPVRKLLAALRIGRERRDRHSRHRVLRALRPGARCIAQALRQVSKRIARM